MFLIIDIIPIIKCLKIFQGSCDTCHISGEVKLLKSYQCLRLFFIPTFKWGFKYYLQPACKTPIEIKEETAIELLHGNLSLNNLHLEHSKIEQYVCSQCGQPLRSEFDYCPYCGCKLNVQRGKSL